MKPFSIAEVREVFAADHARLHAETAALLADAAARPQTKPDLSVARRHAHTLKGMASLVHAHALANWACDLEALFASADSERELTPRSRGILGWVKDRLSAWGDLAAATLREDFAAADRLYAELRHALDDWLGRNSESATPQPALKPPALKKKSEAPSPGTLASPETASKISKPKLRAAPQPIAPPLKIRAAAADTAANPGHLAPVSPQLTTPVPPPLKAAPQSPIDPHASEVPKPMPPVMVAVPRFKRAAANVGPTANTAAVPMGRAPRQLAGPEAGVPRGARRDRDAELLEAFGLDARDQLEALEHAILRLERHEDVPAQLALARRSFHTLKGAANSVGLNRLGTSFHEVEDFIDATTQRADAPLPAGFCEFLLATVDDLRRHLRAADSGFAGEWQCTWTESIQALREGRPLPPRAPVTEAGGEAPATEEPTAAEETQTTRVDVTRLRRLMNSMGDLVVDRNRLERQLQRSSTQHEELSASHQRLMQLVAAFQKEFEFTRLSGAELRENVQRPPQRVGRWQVATVSAPGEQKPAPDEFSELEFDRYDQFNVLTRQLIEVANDLEETIKELRQTQRQSVVGHQKFVRTSRQMQDEAAGLSLRPLRVLFRRLVRAFRDALQAEGKEATLVFEGENTLLDKTLVDVLYAPLLHLVRNAVAHGIESAPERAALGKPAAGQVTVRALASGHNVLIEIEDDGRGIDADRVRARALERGLISDDAPHPLPFPRVVQLLFTPGFSTSAQVTSVSGRGVGLDVVQADLESVGGTIQVHSAAGQGTRWTMQLPLTLSVSEVLIASAGTAKYALPVSFLERALVITPAQLAPAADGKLTYRVGEETLPAFYLADALGEPERPTVPHGLLMRAGRERAVLLVDPGLERLEAAVKPLDAILAQHPLLSAATIDREGRVVFILNVPGLMTWGVTAGSDALGRGSAASSASLRRVIARPKVLVVDDSLSVRKVQQQMLSELGCDVVTASDGLQALERLREHEFRLILTDLEMPGLDGYQLIAEVRGQPRLARVPIVVVTSRTTARHTDRALALGANVCVAKPFTAEQIDALLDEHIRLRPVGRDAFHRVPD